MQPAISLRIQNLKAIAEQLYDEEVRIEEKLVHIANAFQEIAGLFDLLAQSLTDHQFPKPAGTLSE